MNLNKSNFILIFSMVFICFVNISNAQTTNLGTGSGTGGTQNVHIGKDAGTISTANKNTIVGFEAGKSNTSGLDNTFIGYKNGSSNTTGASNTFIGSASGNLNTTGSSNSFIGYASGASNSTGGNNTFFGYFSGYANTTGQGNSYSGTSAGRFNTTGSWNTFLGNEAGYSSITGYQNVYIGNKSGRLNTVGINNAVLGYNAYASNTDGIENVIIGAGAGSNNTSGTGNVFLGCRAGQNEMGSNKLYIANTITATPLIYGEFDNQKLVINGKMGISTNTFPVSVGGVDVSAYKLFVKGGILTEELRVRTGWADYVFNDDYELMSLNDVEQYLIEHKHLPNMPKAEQVMEEGIEIGNMSRLQQEKIEELTLYIIELNKQLKVQKEMITDLGNKIKQ